MATETQTYTYDPTQDALIDEASEARDAETLAIGEKMMAEQENLLAGKYKSTEDLEKAYLELQKKQGKPTKSETLETEETVEEETEEVQYNKEFFYKEDGSFNYDNTEELYGSKLNTVFKENNIDLYAMNEYFAQNEGTLSEEMYSSLADAGLNKDVVGSYLQGLRTDLGWEAAPETPSLSEAEVTAVHNIAGGQEGYNQLMGWASENIPAEDIKNFDDVIETGNKAAVTFAVKALMGQYEDAQGRDSTLIQGKKSAPTEIYRSMSEVVRDMNKPEYETDDAYRDDVRRKLEMSNLKV